MSIAFKFFSGILKNGETKGEERRLTWGYKIELIYDGQSS